MKLTDAIADLAKAAAAGGLPVGQPWLIPVPLPRPQPSPYHPLPDVFVAYAIAFAGNQSPPTITVTSTPPTGDEP